MGGQLEKSMGITGDTDGTDIGNVADRLKVDAAMPDVAPANQTVTTLDVGTSSLPGANGQVFYFGTPTTGSSANFTLASIENVAIETTILGGGGTLVVEVSMDGGTFWLRPNVHQISTQSYTNGFTSNFIVSASTTGMTNIRVRSTTSWSGTATVTIKESVNTRSVVISEGLPTGTNSIGNIGTIGTISAIALPSGAATAVNQTTEITALQILDDVPSADNSTFVKGVPIMGQLDDSATATVSENNVSPVRITSSRALHANLRNTAGTEIGTNGTPIQVQLGDGSVRVDLDNGAGDGESTGLTGLYTNSREYVFGGSGWDRLRTPNQGNNVTGPNLAAAAVGPYGQYNATPVSITDTRFAILQLDAAGALKVVQNSVTKPTYSAAISGLVTAATATDIFTISGSGTRTIRVTKISIDGLAAAGGNVTFNLIKRSATNTGGTSTTLTAVPHDSANAAGTATIRAYTANPTGLGTAVGTVRSNRAFISGVTTTASTEDVEMFGDLGQGIVLRGTGEFLCMNQGGVTITTPALNIWVEWTEE